MIPNNYLECDKNYPHVSVVDHQQAGCPIFQHQLNWICSFYMTAAVGTTSAQIRSGTGSWCWEGLSNTVLGGRDLWCMSEPQTQRFSIFVQGPCPASAQSPVSARSILCTHWFTLVHWLLLCGWRWLDWLEAGNFFYHHYYSRQNTPVLSAKIILR